MRPGGCGRLGGWAAAALQGRPFAHGRRRQTERTRRDAWRSRVGAAAARCGGSGGGGCPSPRDSVGPRRLGGERLGHQRDPPCPARPRPPLNSGGSSALTEAPAAQVEPCGGPVGRAETDVAPPSCYGGETEAWTWTLGICLPVRVEIQSSLTQIQR